MSHQTFGVIVGALMAVLAGSARVSAQEGPRKAHWLTDGYDKERTSWQRDETRLSPSTVAGMKLLWKVQLDTPPRQLHNLFPALIAGDVATATGAREMAIVAGVSDTIYGIDVERGTQVWKRQFDRNFESVSSREYVLCPGGLTATPVIVAGSTPGKYTVYAISWDGRLRTLDAATGEETAAAEPFLPPNGKPYGLNYHDNVLYTTTAQGCGGNPNQFYSYDLATRKVGSFDPGSGGLWPRLGPSIGRDGRVYAGSGDGDYIPERQIFGQAIIAARQNPSTKAMEMQDWFAPTNAFWLRKRDLDMNVTGPVFEYKGREYTVQSSKECRIWLLDTAALGGEDHRTPVYRTPLICNEEVHFSGAGPWGALATWEDADGTRWVLLPFWGPKHPDFTAPIEHGEVVYGAVAAFKLQRRANGLQLTPAWLSRNMVNADPVVIANGVVFAYGSGEDPTQASVDIGLAFNSAANRSSRSTRATLYALDARTGRELWSSGDQIATFNHFTSLSVANGRVYIGTFDGVLYCFGLDAAAATK